MILPDLKFCRLYLYVLGWAFFMMALLLPASMIADDASMKMAVDAFEREGQQRIKEGKPPRSIIDLYIKYSDEDRRTVLRNWAHNNIFLDGIPDKWRLIDEASVALFWVKYEKEPLEVSVLSALARCLQNPLTADERFHVNVLLYRYSTTGSREYIFEKLETGNDLNAATVLALNREKDALKLITPLVEAGKADAWLLYALGQWGMETDEALIRGMGKAEAVALMNYLFALAMASHHIGEKEIQEIRDLTKSESDVVRIAAVGLLLHCHHPVDGGMEYLKGALSNHGSASAYYAAWSLNHIEGAIPQKQFREMLMAYLEVKDSNAFAVEYYEALVGVLKTPTDDDWVLALKVLHSLPMPNRLDSRYPTIPVAALLYAHGSDLVRAEAVKHVGDRLNLGLAATDTLKRIPPKYLPIPSLRVEWTHTDLGSGGLNK